MLCTYIVRLFLNKNKLLPTFPRTDRLRHLLKVFFLHVISTFKRHNNNALYEKFTGSVLAFYLSWIVPYSLTLDAKLHLKL